MEANLGYIHDLFEEDMIISFGSGPRSHDFFGENMIICFGSEHRSHDLLGEHTIISFGSGPTSNDLFEEDMSISFVETVDELRRETRGWFAVAVFLISSENAKLGLNVFDMVGKPVP